MYGVYFAFNTEGVDIRQFHMKLYCNALTVHACPVHGYLPLPEYWRCHRTAELDPCKAQDIQPSADVKVGQHGGITCSHSRLQSACSHLAPHCIAYLVHPRLGLPPELFG